jgi:hypothetical protein
MTRTILPPPRDDHQAMQALLPWYVTGALEPAEREVVRAHLADCAQCRAELADERRLAPALAELPADNLPDVDSGWAALARQLDREEEPAASRDHFAAGRRAAGAPASGRMGGRRDWMRWAIAAQFAAIVVLGGLAWRGETSTARYHTLSSAQPPLTANLVVMFQPDTSEKAMRDMLRATGARLVDGPTSTDAYLLHVAPGVRTAALQTLRRNPAVSLAQPLDQD